MKDIGNIPETELQLVKTKLRKTCEKHRKIKVPYKYTKIINELRKREDIAVLKADKGRDAVIMNREKYHGKCFELLDTEQFQKLNHDRTKQLRLKYKMLCEILSQNFQLTSINEYIRPDCP